jgi:hypothetical protein
MYCLSVSAYSFAARFAPANKISRATFFLGVTVSLQRLPSAYMPGVRLVPLVELLLLAKFIGLHACASGASIIVFSFIVPFIGIFTDICVSAGRTFVFGWLNTLFGWLKLCVRLAEDFFHQTFGRLNVYVVAIGVLAADIT